MANEFVIYWSDLTADAQARILEKLQISFKLSLTRPVVERGNQQEKDDIIRRKFASQSVVSQTVTPQTITPSFSVIPPISANTSAMEEKEISVIETTKDVVNTSEPEIKSIRPEVKVKGLPPTGRKRGHSWKTGELEAMLDFIGEHDREFGGSMSIADISRELNISYNTIRKYRKTLKEKLAQ